MTFIVLNPRQLYITLSVSSVWKKSSKESSGRLGLVVRGVLAKLGANRTGDGFGALAGHLPTALSLGGLVDERGDGNRCWIHCGVYRK